MTYQPTEGEYVRVVLEGKVINVVKRDGGFAIHLGEYNTPGLDFIRSESPSVKSIERITPPEQWEPGDVVIDADGDTYERRDDPVPWRDFDDCTYLEGYPTRPLVLLARAGKPVKP